MNWKIGNYPYNYTQQTNTTTHMIRSTHPEPLKVEAVAPFAPAHDIQEVRCEDERYPLPAHAEEALPVTQDVTEVDVKQVP